MDKKIQFVRYGILNYSDNKKSKFLENEYGNKSTDFHSPPERKGLYCFPENIIERFIVPPFYEDTLASILIQFDERYSNLEEDYAKIKNKLVKQIKRDKELRNHAKRLFKKNEMSTEYKYKGKSPVIVENRLKRFSIHPDADIYTHLGKNPSPYIMAEINSWYLIKAKYLNCFISDEMNFLRITGRKYSKDQFEIFIPKRTKIF